MNRRKKTLVLPHVRARKLVIGLGIAVLLLLIVGVIGAAIQFGGSLGTASPTLLGMLALPLLLGTVTVDEDKEFQDKLLKGIESQNNRLASIETEFKSQKQKVLDDLDRLDKDGKKAMDELTKVKNHCNDQAELMRKMEQAQKIIVRTARSSFGDPIRRALEGNEELRFALNAAVRYVFAKKDGELDRLDPAFKKLVEDENKVLKVLTGVDSSLGQATVPQQTFNEIYDTLLEYGDWNTLGVQRVGARTTVLPVATARPQFYWIGNQTGGTAEGSAITAGAFTGGSVNLIIQTLAVLMYLTREILADSSVDLAPWVLHQMVEAVSQGMDTAAFISTGASDQTNAGYTGLFQAATANANLAATAGAGNTTVGALQLEDFVRCLTTVNPQVLKRKSRWWVHPQILAKIALVRDANRRPLFQTWQEVPNPGSIGSILGYPVTPTAIAPSTDSAAQPVVAFGDPMGVAVGIRQDLELATSDDIAFHQNLRAYRTLLRAGVKLKTQAASTTLKPFAVLTLAAA